MVMIHAGAFSWGSGSVHQQGNPDYVMHQDIIYITLNYRLHALGNNLCFKWFLEIIIFIFSCCQLL